MLSSELDPVNVNCVKQKKQKGKTHVRLHSQHSTMHCLKIKTFMIKEITICDDHQSFQ